MTLRPEDLPPYSALMYPVLVAVKALGGSASGREITDRVLEAERFTEDQISVTYGSRDKSVLVDRLEWARLYCKLGGALDSPARKLYLLSQVGHEILSSDEAEARVRLAQLDRTVRAARSRKPRPTAGIPEAAGSVESMAEPAPTVAIDADEDSAWTEVLLGRLHRLSPEAFEEFALSAATLRP